MNKKRVLVAVFVLVVIVVAAIIIIPQINPVTSMGGDNANPIVVDPNKSGDDIVAEEMQELFSMYTEYGVTFGEETQKLYYNGELIKTLVDSYRDLRYEQADGTVNLKVTRDNDGKITSLDVK